MKLETIISRLVKREPLLRRFLASPLVLGRSSMEVNRSEFEDWHFPKLYSTFHFLPHRDHNAC
jgi:hypothetical protein